jgi:DNA-3-methyladenine glycosylase
VVGGLTRDALCGSVLSAARALLGARLTHRTDGGDVTVRLTEVEAYDGPSDPASHAYRGRTSRNAVMFGRAGRLYVYRSYGLHWCCNVVTGPDGEASAVLLRAGRVVDGMELARTRRGPRVPEAGLARGPACLTQALGIDGSHDGADLIDGSVLRLDIGDSPSETDPLTGPRVGVSRAHDVPWRLWIAGDDTVSSYKRSPRATAKPAGARQPR